MPGLIFSTYSADKNQQGIQSLFRNNRYSHKTFVNQNNCFIATHSHDLYPIHVFDSNNYLTVLEGMIYNDDPEIIVKNIIDHLNQNNITEIANQIKNIDGEFCAIFREKDTGIVTLINDHFGRLPMYFKKTKEGIAISREIQFILNVDDQEEINRLSVAHQLLFGYTLGEHTLWEDIKRIQPNSIIQINPENPRLEYKSFFKLDKQEQPGSIRKLSDTFEEALKNRLEKFPNAVLSLSGGLDSRLIAAATSHLNYDVICATYSSEGKTNDLDVKIARDVKTMLEFSKHYVFETAAKPDSSAILLQSKAGLNYLGMDFILPFHEWHQKNNFISITGDGGDKFFVDLIPNQKLTTPKQFLNFLIHHNGNTSVKTVSEITGLSEDEIEESILAHVTGYPDKKWDERYMSFLIRERGINWLFEGEDRSRYFTWTTSPYYAPSVIMESLKFTQAEKKHAKLFIRLFEDYRVNLAGLINPNWNCPPNDSIKVKILFSKQRIKSLLKHNKKDQYTLEQFRYKRDFEQLLKSSQIFDTAILGKKHCSEECIWNVYTILRLEEYQSKNSGSRIVAL